jgi:hypothetical protein
MLDSREFFLRYSGLQPNGYQCVGMGMCDCQTAKPIIVYKKGKARQCAACICLRQAYDTAADKAKVRLQVGSYLFVSPTRVQFWGNHNLRLYNPQIECETATGKMSEVQRSLILSPPDPPWMFISFSKSTSADNLAITTDPAVLRFSGDTVINRTKIREINRTQIMRMFDAGLSRKDWDQYLDAFYQGSPTDIETMRSIEQSYPALAAIRRLPPRQSTEHVVLRWLLQTKSEPKQFRGDEQSDETRVEETEDAV